MLLLLICVLPAIGLCGRYAMFSMRWLVSCSLSSVHSAQIKVLVVYLCMGLVSLILGTIAVRAVVAFATWLVAGRALWLLPNALSDVRWSRLVLQHSRCHGLVLVRLTIVPTGIG